MAKINLGKIVAERLSGEFKDILGEMLKELKIETEVDSDKLFRTFRDRVRYHFRHNAEVPDDCVEVKEK